MRELKKQKFLKNKKLVRTTTFLSILLIATALLLSSSVTAINVTSTSPNMNNNNNGEMKVNNPGHIYSTAIKNGESVNMLKTPPTPSEESLSVDWIHYDDGVNYDAIGLTSGGTFEEAVRFSPTELGPYSGYSITQVQVWQGYSASEPSHSINIKIYEADTPIQPGNVIYTQAETTAAGYGFQTFILDTPVDIAGDADLWVSIEWLNTIAGNYPAGVDQGPAVDTKSDWYYIGSWVEVQIYGLDYNNMIYAGVELLIQYDHDVGVQSINAPVSGPAGVITPKVTVKNFGLNTETSVPVEIVIGTTTTVTTTVLSENFEGGVPPAGWTNVQNAGSYGWLPNTYWGRYNYAGTGVCADADVDAAYSNPMDCELRSSVFSLVGFSSATLAWDNYFYLFASDYAKVDVSTNGGSSWTNVFTKTGVYIYGSFEHDSVSLPVGSANTMIRFHYYAPYWDYYWEVDNVVVSGQQTTFIAEYDETEIIPSIAAGATAQVTFTPSWTPDAWQNEQNTVIDYVVDAATQLVDDNPSNDAKAVTVALSYPFLHDVEVTSINSPTAEDGPGQVLPVGATIKNVGQFDECCYQTEVTIGQQIIGPTIWSEYFTSGIVPPTGWTDQHKSIAYYYGWSASYSSMSGGSPYEALLPYYYCVANYIMYTSPINLGAYSGAVLQFKSYIDHWSGQGLYVLHCVASTDNGATWSYVWDYAPSGSGKFDVSVTIPTGPNVRVGWVVTGNPYYFNYWYIDNVEIKSLDIAAEYNAVACTIELSPGESIDLEFDDWTPAALEARISGEVDYLVAAEQLLPGDTNPANDKATGAFTLDYWHDVKVKSITDPSKRSQETFYASDAIGNILVSFDPASPGVLTTLGPNTAPSYISAGTWADGVWYVSPYSAPLLYSVDPTSGVMTLIGGSGTAYNGIAYDDNSGTMYGASSYNLYSIDITTGAQTMIGTWGSSYLMIDIAIDNDGVCYGHDIVTDSIYKIDLTNAAATLVGSTGLSANYLQGMEYDKETDILYLAAYTSFPALYSVNVDTGQATLVGNFPSGTEIDGFAIPYTAGPPGPADVKVWVPLNSNEAIAGIVQNLGVFVEEGLTAYADIIEYITDPNGTNVYSNNIPNIDLDEPLGGEENLVFPNYVFGMQGIYTLIINIPLTADVDDFPNNNQMKLGIGCDNTKPTSTHALSPATPNGLNGWYVSDVTVTMDAGDGTDEWQSGVKEIVYKVDGVQKTVPGKHGSFKIEDDGENIAVEYWAVDNVGNEETPHHTFTIDMDQTKPTISLVYEVTGGNPITGYEITFTATSTDETSGMERVDFYLNSLFEVSVTGSGPTYQWIVELGNVPHTIIRAIGYDMAGNNDFDEIEDPTPHSNEQSLPQSVTQTLKLNLGR